MEKDIDYMFILDIRYYRWKKNYLEYYIIMVKVIFIIDYIYNSFN